MKIIYDSKEKMPWNFSFYGVEQYKGSLKTGDYTIEGMEDIVIIERKRNANELAINLGSKSKQFKKEFIRFEPFKYKFLICESSVDDLISFPINSGLPANVIKKIKITGKFLSSSLFKLCEEHGVELFFTGCRSSGEELAYNLFKEVYDKETNITGQQCGEITF